ncbi:MAG: hypothetical protein MJ107_01175 [Lachnospiraceae bacterium]|nr:hypothetical protein [Lachnospiraceae bacterium]
MNRVLTTVGDYAESPYYVDKVFVNVYSAEELCYVLYENAFILDQSILDKKLALWVDRELHLPDLARDLIVLANQNASPSAFVGTILTYVGFYSKNEISRVENILRMNVSMNVFEKWKAKADFLVENKHYALAIREYEKLLKVLPEDEQGLLSAIYNNMGITYMNLSLFDSAVKFFLASFDVDGNEDAYRHYLTVKRMSLRDDEYVRFIASRDDAYNLSIELESRMEELNQGFDKSDEAQALNELFALRSTGESAKYYEEIGKITEELKEDYRDIVLDSGQSESFTETFN